jgi:hypothetical protein
MILSIDEIANLLAYWKEGNEGWKRKHDNKQLYCDTTKSIFGEFTLGSIGSGNSMVISRLMF